MEEIKRMVVVTPMCVGVGEPIKIKVKVCGDVKIIENVSAFNTKTPRLKSWSNKAPRGSCFIDDTIDGWSGVFDVEAEGALDGPGEIVFDGINQGACVEDKRAIKVFDGWKWKKAGIYNIKLTDRKSGFTALSNPVVVTQDPPENRAYFGDIHWQTYFTDGVRGPEELYYFAKDEGFLDFGAITDHSEGITDRQWDYMCMVAEDFNVADEFSTLVGQEWTSFSPSHCGHRNVYYRDGKRRPIMRADDPKYDELEKLYAALKDEEALIIPHHSSNAVMGVEWNVGFDEKHEIAAEMHSCWGSSELSEEDGNIAAIKMHNGTKPGRFVMDALRMGRKYGFVGGGDIHCGRPGDSLPFACWETEDGIKYTHMYVAGFTCVSLPQNTRENIYDAIKNRATWVTTQQRYYLEYGIDGNNMGSVIAAGNGEHVLHVLCATNEDIVDCRLMGKDGEVKIFKPDEENKMRIRIDEKLRLEEGFYYIRVTTAGGNMAWASPIWITK